MISTLRSHFAGTAAAVDSGAQDVRAGLRLLGERGLLDSDLRGSVELVRELAGGCLATAFAVWSQSMVLGYVAGSPELVAELRTGRVTGATALAPAIADLAGRAPVPVMATEDGPGWRLRGPIHWVSNLFDDAVVVTPARTAAGDRLVAAFRLDAAGVERTAPADLLALNGTGTGGLELDAVRVEAVLSRDLGSFLTACRPAMLLMQSALAVGLAEAALAAAAPGLTGVNATLAGDHSALDRRHAEVAARLGALAAGQEQPTRPGLARLRLDAMGLAAAAVRLETVVAGGRGYRAASETSRRVREAAFLPVQAPTEGQLRADAAA
jgi:hypothetical protein